MVFFGGSHRGSSSTASQMYDRDWSVLFFRISPSCLLTGLVAAACGYHDMAVTEMAVSITSMLHWRNPKRGWSCWRVLDMAVVVVSLVAHLCAMWTASARLACGVMLVSMGCFGWSLVYDAYEHHAAGWTLACLSNLLLTAARVYK